MSLTDVGLLGWLGGARSDAGVAVTEQRVLGLPAYFRALAITAGTLATLPLHMYREGDRDKVAKPPVLVKPNPRQTEVEWRVTRLLHALAWGNSFGRKVRDGSGQVREVWPVHPSRCRVEEVEPTAAAPDGKLFLLQTKHGQVRRTSHDILHLPYMSMTGVEGIRPLEIFRQSLGIAIAGDDSAAHFYGNGSQLAGILSTDKKLEEGSATALKKRWRDLTAGVDHAGDIAVLDNGAKYAPIAIPPKDAELLGSRQWSVGELARMVGTPPHLIGDVERSTSWGAGIEQQVLGWVKFTLQLWITSDEQRIAAELAPPRHYLRHSLEGLLRGDSKARASFYHQAIIDGWLNRNEVRELEDRTPVDGLDDYLVPSNMTLSLDGQLIPLASSALSDTEEPT